MVSCVCLPGSDDHLISKKFVVAAHLAFAKALESFGAALNPAKTVVYANTPDAAEAADMIGVDAPVDATDVLGMHLASAVEDVHQVLQGRITGDL